MYIWHHCVVYFTSEEHLVQREIKVSPIPSQSMLYICNGHQEVSMTLPCLTGHSPASITVCHILLLLFISGVVCCSSAEWCVVSHGKTAVVSWETVEQNIVRLVTVPVFPSFLPTKPGSFNLVCCVLDNYFFVYTLYYKIVYILC